MNIDSEKAEDWISASPLLQESFANENLHEILMNSTAVGVILVQDDQVLFANSAMRNYIGTKEPTIVGINPYTLFYEADRKQIKQLCTNVMEHHEPPRGFEARISRVDDTPLWVECHPTVIQLQNRQAALLTLTDISARKKLAEAETALQTILLAAIEQSPAGLMIVDYPDMIVRSANREAKRLRGYDDSVNPVGQPILDFSMNCRFLNSNEVQYKHGEYPLNRALDGGESISNEEMIVERPDGSREWVLVQAEPITNDAGETIAGIILTSDITERKVAEESIKQLVEDLQHVKRDLEKQNSDLQRAEERINASLDQYTDLYENAPVGYLSISTKGVVERANMTACKILNISNTTLMHRSIMNLVVSRHMSTLADHLASVVEQQKRLSCEVELKADDEERRFVRIESAPATTKDGTSHLRVAVVDISKRMHAEIKLARSEQRYRMIVESPLSIVGVIGADYKVTFASQGLCDISRYPYRELIGRDFRDFLTDEQRELVSERYERRRKGEKVPDQYELDMIIKDGTKRSLIANFFLVTGPGGRMETVFNAVDITYRKEAQEKLMRLEEQFMKLFEQSLDAVYVLTNEQFIKVNPAFEKMFGYTSNEICSPDFEICTLISPPDRERITNRINNMINSREVDLAPNFTGIDSKGNELALQSTSALINWDGSPAILGFVRDLTDQQRMTRQIKQIKGLDSMGRVAGGIAHDFRNLLAVISGQAEISAMRIEKTDPIQEDLATILKTAESAKELTQNLLDFSREREITPKRLDLNELVHYLEQMLLRLLGSDLKLRLELTAEKMPIVADSSQLEQVLVNLVANARDASKAGDTITIRTEANYEINPDESLLDLEPGNYVYLCVKDEGAGMSDETMEHMFEPFYTTKERGKGTGLGLSTVFGSIKQNRGHVEVNSKLGTGTEFRIILPVANENGSS